MTAFLFLDLGTKTGYAVGDFSDAGQTVVTGTELFENDKFSGGGARMLAFRRWLTKMHDLFGFTEVGYEGVRAHKGVDAAHIYGGLMGHLTAWCEEQGVAYSAETVQAIKKFATGKGNAPKEAVIAAVRDWGYAPADDNEADAIAGLHLFASEREITVDCRK